MISSAFYYFQSIYGNADEPVVCIDGDLNVVFATTAAYETFGIAKSPALHLNCILMRKYLYTVNASFDTGEFTTFNIESTHDNTYKKCVFIPISYDGEKFAVLLFSDIESDEIDNMRKYELKRAIHTIESAIATSTSLMVSHLRLIQNNVNKDNSVNVIYKNVLNIRRIFKNLSVIAGISTKCSIPNVIELNSYIKYFSNVIQSQLGSSRIAFEFNFCNSVLVSEMEPKIFEILICNIVSNSVKNTFGKAKIIIQTATQEKFNLVVVSDNGIGCKNISAMFSSSGEKINNMVDDFLGLGTSTIRKIVSDHGGQVFAIENRTGGISVGFTLPKSENRQPILRSPEELSADRDEIFSTVRIEMADLLDINNINF